MNKDYREILGDFNWSLRNAKNKDTKRKIRKMIENETAFRKNNIQQKGNKQIKLEFKKFNIWTTSAMSHSVLHNLPQMFKIREANTPNEFKAKNNIILDVGAHEGYYVIQSKMKNPNSIIIAVEPNPYAIKLFKKNIKENKALNVLLVEKAISDKNGKINFEVIRQASSLGSVKICRDKSWLKEGMIEKIKVPAITLDKLFKDYLNEKEVEILKIDVEGFEFDVLKGGEKALKKTKKIEMDYHSKVLKLKCISFIKKENFKLIKQFKVTPEMGTLFFIKEKNKA